MIYGIRPEHIEIGEGGLPVKVVGDRADRVGDPCLCQGRKGPDRRRRQGADSARPGETVEFLIDPADVHLFDRKTEKRL